MLYDGGGSSVLEIGAPGTGGGSAGPHGANNTFEYIRLGSAPLEFSALRIDASATLAAPGTLIFDTLVNQGQINLGSADYSLTVVDSAVGTGVIDLHAGTVTFGGTVGNQTLNFAKQPGGEALIDEASEFAGTISNFVLGDTIDLTGFVAAGESFSNNALVLTDTVSNQVTLDIQGSFSTSSFLLAGDSGSGTDVTIIPIRDLYLSPEHALYIDGALVPARLLTNGATIGQVESVERVEYFHIELETHDVILAEGAPAESYVDCDTRSMFQNAGEFAARYPEDDRPAWRFCAPRLEEASAALGAIRAKLLERAAAQGWVTDDPDPHLLVDGEIVRAHSATDRVWRFAVPAGARTLALASRSVVPAEIDAGARDIRRLGVAVERITLADSALSIEIGHGHAALHDGFHADEGTHRWTDGLARLPTGWLCPFPTGCTLEVRLTPAKLHYPVEPDPTAAAA